MSSPSYTLIGAGLVGALLARLLAQQGARVDVFEKLPDPRTAGFSGGRSINLALAERGLRALRSAGLDEAVKRQAVMVRGRMVHPRDGGPAALHRYGVDDSEVNWSVSRAALNTLLLDAAEAAGVRFHFGQQLVDAELADGRLQLRGPDGQLRQIDAATVIGSDGAGSSVRAAMARRLPLGERIEPLHHGYKELEIPARTGEGDARFAIEPHALHIWPRGGYMAMALPNAEGSFTVTLFLPVQGAHPSFAGLPDAAHAGAFFAQDFPDLLPLIEHFAADYDAHPVGTLATLYLDRWHLDGRAVLVGDAAHAIVPFHGQGMNCGFEDTVVLARLLAEHRGDTGDAYAQFQQQRQPDTRAIAAMALENYVEMRDSVADPHYLAKRTLGALLAERAPRHFMPRYRMVTFTHLPYAYAYQRGAQQDQLLETLLAGSDDAYAVDLDRAVEQLCKTLPMLPTGLP